LTVTLWLGRLGEASLPEAEEEGIGGEGKALALVRAQV